MDVASAPACQSSHANRTKIHKEVTTTRPVFLGLAVGIPHRDLTSHTVTRVLGNFLYRS